MRCAYCDDWFGSAKTVLNADRRIKTPRGEVHAKCLVYLFIDLGIESALGDLETDERRLIFSRFNVPTPETDKLKGISRFSLHSEVENSTGIKGPLVTYPLKVLIQRLEARSEQTGDLRARVADASEHLDQARKLLGDGPF